MNFLRRDERGVISSAVAVTLLSAVLGGGAAVAAVVAIVSANAPDDTRAVQTGPAAPVPPQQLIPYGG